MAKGIIVLDKIPRTCQHIRGNKEEGCPFGGMFCQICDMDVMEHVIKGTKPDWCPIKLMPERKTLTGDLSDITKMGVELVRVGFNACLDEIEELCKGGGDD